MSSRENAMTVTEDSNRRHPLWDVYQFADGSLFYFNPFTFQASLDFPRACPNALGGILADEMGMGKTVEAIALMLQNRPANWPLGMGIVCHFNTCGAWMDLLCYLFDFWSILSSWLCLLA